MIHMGKRVIKLKFSESATSHRMPKNNPYGRLTAFRNDTHVPMYLSTSSGFTPSARFPRSMPNRSYTSTTSDVSVATLGSTRSRTAPARRAVRRHQDRCCVGWRGATENARADPQAQERQSITIAEATSDLVMFVVLIRMAWGWSSRNGQEQQYGRQ